MIRSAKSDLGNVIQCWRSEGGRDCGFILKDIVFETGHHCPKNHWCGCMLMSHKTLSCFFFVFLQMWTLMIIMHIMSFFIFSPFKGFCGSKTFPLFVPESYVWFRKDYFFFCHLSVSWGLILLDGSSFNAGLYQWYSILKWWGSRKTVSDAAFFLECTLIFEGVKDKQSTNNIRNYQKAELYNLGLCAKIYCYSRGQSSIQWFFHQLLTSWQQMPWFVNFFFFLYDIFFRLK